MSLASIVGSAMLPSARPAPRLGPHVDRATIDRVEPSRAVDDRLWRTALMFSFMIAIL